MRTTTDHVTNVIIPIAATASTNAQTAQSAAAATQLLVVGIGGIEDTAHALRDRAAELEQLLGRFTVDEAVRPRKFPRFRVAFEVTYAIDGKSTRKGRARNLCGGGICIESDESVPVDTSTTIRFELPGADTIEARGQVVSTDYDQTHGVHVHHIAFSAISDKVRDSILAYISDGRRQVLTTH